MKNFTVYCIRLSKAASKIENESLFVKYTALLAKGHLFCSSPAKLCTEVNHTQFKLATPIFQTAILVLKRIPCSLVARCTSDTSALHLQMVVLHPAQTLPIQVHMHAFEISMHSSRMFFQNYYNIYLSASHACL